VQAPLIITGNADKLNGGIAFHQQSGCLFAVTEKGPLAIDLSRRFGGTGMVSASGAVYEAKSVSVETAKPVSSARARPVDLEDKANAIPIDVVKAPVIKVPSGRMGSRALIFQVEAGVDNRKRFEAHGVIFTASSTDGLIGEGGTVRWVLTEGVASASIVGTDPRASIKAVELLLGPHPQATSAAFSFGISAMARKDALSAPYGPQVIGDADRIVIVAGEGWRLSEFRLWADSTDQVRIVRGTVYLNP
jgi:hypothetical protein